MFAFVLQIEFSKHLLFSFDVMLVAGVSWLIRFLFIATFVSFLWLRDRYLS